MIHIYQPPSWLGRAVRHCTTCKQRRRFVVRLYELYPQRWTCGGCGYTFTSGEGRSHATEKERQSNRRWVRDQWPTVKRLREVIKQLCDAIHSYEGNA